MASTPGVCNNYRRDALRGRFLDTHTYKAALYTSAAVMSPSETSAYTPADEVAGVGYVAGGQALTGFIVQLFADVACLDFDDVVWDPSSITARYMLIYDDDLVGKDAVCIIDFGADYTSVNGPFRANLPAPGALTSLIQWA